jgi:hypothetical protein
MARTSCGTIVICMPDDANIHLLHNDAARRSNGEDRIADRKVPSVLLSGVGVGECSRVALRVLVEWLSLV